MLNMAEDAAQISFRLHSKKKAASGANWAEVIYIALTRSNPPASPPPSPSPLLIIFMLRNKLRHQRFFTPPRSRDGLFIAPRILLRGRGKEKLLQNMFRGHRQDKWIYHSWNKNNTSLQILHSWLCIANLFKGDCVCSRQKEQKNVYPI